MNKTQIAAFYFPNYHIDPRNEAVHGSGWTEWELMKIARPRFPGHQQPKVPLWGYEDEADPAVMSRKIDAAADSGISAFLFDWYYYNDGPFLERALREGFQKAPNANRLNYALMWANHDWTNCHPLPADRASMLLYPGAVTPETFERMTDYIIETHFLHPSYWKIDDCPFFSIYEIYRLAESFGGWDGAAEALNRFRQKVCAAGFPGLHINGILWGVKLLPGENTIADPCDIVRKLRFDSVTSYVWVHHAELKHFPITPYREVLEENQRYWETARHEYPVPYFPNVTVGWDPSPRTIQKLPYRNEGYPMMATMDSSPEEFGEAIRAAVKFAEQLPESSRIVTVNAWNEWTEGSYLEPDLQHGSAYLDMLQTIITVGNFRRNPLSWAEQGIA